jgi:hypothetical protein
MTETGIDIDHPGVDQSRVKRRRATFVGVLVAAVVAVAISTAQSSAHAAFDPSAAQGVKELPTYLITGVVAYALCLPGLFLLRRGRTQTRAGWVSLVYALLGLMPFVLDYWTALPVTFGALGLLAGLDAGRRRTGRVGIVLGGLAIVASVGLLIYRMSGGLAHT